MIARSTYRYPLVQRDDEQVRQRIKDVAHRHRRYGYRRITVELGKDEPVNHKRVYRIYREEGLQVRRRRRRKLILVRQPLIAATRRGERWSADFITDSLVDGRRYRVLAVLDQFTRECKALYPATSLPSRVVTQVLDELGGRHGLPQTLVTDNGPEFVAARTQAWADRNGVAHHRIQPGRPMQNAFIESFLGKFRDECLNENWFRNLKEVINELETWREHYNRSRPHSALGGQPGSVPAGGVIRGDEKGHRGLL